MRVETVEKLPKRAWQPREASSDGPSGRALQSFLAAVNSEDSLFLVECLGSGSSSETGEISRVFSGEFLITFKPPENTQNNRLHFSLIEKLTELFRNAGSSVTLAAILCLSRVPPRDTNKSGLALELRLEANGDSVEQAEIRWGLGLAHVQQALLFASRWLRQKDAARTN